MELIGFWIYYVSIERFLSSFNGYCRENEFRLLSFTRISSILLCAGVSMEMGKYLFIFVSILIEKGSLAWM